MVQQLYVVTGLFYLSEELTSNSTNLVELVSEYKREHIDSKHQK